MGIEPMTSSPAWYLLNHWAKEVLFVFLSLVWFQDCPLVTTPCLCLEIQLQLDSRLPKTWRHQSHQRIHLFLRFLAQFLFRLMSVILADALCTISFSRLCTSSSFRRSQLQSLIVWSSFRWQRKVRSTSILVLRVFPCQDLSFVHVEWELVFRLDTANYSFLILFVEFVGASFLSGVCQGDGQLNRFE